MSPQERIRWLLQKRLGQIGVAPDMRNDGPAVRAVAQYLNASLEEVVDQLVALRTEQNLAMARRMGQESLSPGSLTLLAASRDALLRDGDLAGAFRHRAQQGVRELAGALEAVLPRPRVVAV